MSQNTAHTFTTQIGGNDVTIEAGRLAQQAGGAVTVRMGDTMLFCTATMSRSAREGIDFFPLSVDYEERLYAAGRIPGSFMRREGRPSDHAILVSRVIDRTLRPLFPDGMRNEVQIILMSLSQDDMHQADMLGILAASTALLISDIPWDGPVAGVRIGLVDGELVVNPTTPSLVDSRLNLRVSGTADAINMVECAADEVDEATMLKALNLAQTSIQPLLAIQHEIRAVVGKEKSAFIEDQFDPALVAAVADRAGQEVEAIAARNTDRHALNAELDVLRDTIRAEYEARNATLPAEEQIDLKQVKEAYNKVIKRVVRRRIVQGMRPDGRDTVSIRALSADTGLVPRVHGSGLFQRGETQVLSIATLGTPRDSQMLDNLSPDDTKRYMHHYNFPPYSTGETWFMRGPKRREIGHGSLAENALVAMIPSEDDFPYTLRVVSEVMSSNGSTSMASVCGSTLALMDAGVPIRRPVAGIAMGLIKEGDDVAILTDIQGMEDHLGDMDFKVAGTAEGITALQMDIKISGVSGEIMAQALEQARQARLQILDVMLATIPQPRQELSDYAPRMHTIRINPEKIGVVIGPGGKTIRGIQDEMGVSIDISEEGKVFISGPDGPSVMRAEEFIRGLTEDPEIGAIYTGKVKRTENYGAFVEFMPGKEGMVHVSQLADYRVESVESEVSVGDEIMVMVVDIDDGGRVRLSRQAVLEGWTAEEARAKDRGGRKPSGDRNRGGGNRGGDRPRRSE
jgi:polyribonucleotide nucleotidyltransferase